MKDQSGEQMEKKLALVLSGGGSRGALQVGALQAIYEFGFQPDLIVGVSVGSVNGAYLALNGLTQASLDRMVAVWRDAVQYDLLPSNYLRIALRRMLGRGGGDPAARLREFMIAQGLSAELTFAALIKPQLVVVSADLNAGKPVLHGLDGSERVLDSVLLSTALPPWFMPIRKQNAYLVDGGMVSNLPIEPALHLGATHIVALDLMDSREWQEDRNGVTGFLDRLTYSVERRYADLELALAKAQGVPTLYLGLSEGLHIPFWDFQHTDEMIAQGYEIARRVLEASQDEIFPDLRQVK